MNSNTFKEIHRIHLRAGPVRHLTIGGMAPTLASITAEPPAYMEQDRVPSAALGQGA